MVKKVLLLIIFSFFAFQSFSQQIRRIELIRSDSLKGVDKTTIRVINPIFSHEGATLASDSANLNEQLNTFDAFGHIVITQSDGTTIRSDLLNYNGNTRMAVLTKNVRLTDKQGAVLTTNNLTYNMATKIGNYTDGGKIVNGADVLTSKTGYYFVNSRDAYFRHDVSITSKDAIVKADTLRYNTGTKIASFFGPTNIYGKKDTLYTEEGTYNTDSLIRQAHGFKNNLYQQGGRTMRSDTIFYDDRKGTGKANGNIVFKDAEEQITMRGDIGIYSRADSSMLVTKNSYISLVTQDSAKVDSIFMTADTLLSKVIMKDQIIPVKKPGKEEATAVPSDNITGDKPVVPIKIIPKDTLAIKTPLPDTVKARAKDTSKVRVVYAFHHVKIFKSDLQAVADSVFYSYADSVIRCYSNPMVWSQGSQLSADTILMQLKDKKLNTMFLQHDGLIVSTKGDSTKYDQVKGRLITGTFKNNQLDEMFVNGNAESVYYAMEDSSYTGMTKTVSSQIRMKIENKGLKNIKLYKAQAQYYPMDKIPPDTEILKGFMWKPKDRPQSKEAIIPGLKSQLAATASKPLKEGTKSEKIVPK